MPFDTAEFRISLQKLFLALVVILIPIMLFGLYVGLQANRQVQRMSGAYFRTITRASAAITSEYLAERVAEVQRVNIMFSYQILLQARQVMLF